ncbi:MAG: hypothetical protein WCG75_09890 [Armatimonadota bacterium]
MKRLLGNAALMTISLTCAFVLLELGMRIYSGVPVLSTANFVARSLDIIRATAGAMDFDDLLGWRLKENLGAPGQGWSTTRFGIRTNGVTLELPEKGAVISVGDSFTAGSGVRDEETWPAQLEKRIGAPVINGAAGAWGVDQMVLRAETLAEIFSPSTIIVGVLAQDSLRNKYDIHGGGFKPWFKVVNGKAILQGVPVPRFEDAPEGLSISRSIFGHSWLVHWTMNRLGRMEWWVSNLNRYREVLSNEEGVAVSCALMPRLDALKTRYGSKIIIVLLWGAQESSEATPPWYGPPVMECAKKAGFDTLDLYPVLHEISKSDPIRFKRLWIDENGTLGHPTAEGHALTARLLQENFFKK